MKPRTTRFLVAIAVAAGMPAMANAQQVGSAPPAPGTGDSTKITTGNQQNNSEYNHLINSGNDKPSKDDDRRTHQAPVAATAVDANQAIVDTGQTKIGVPIQAFGKDDSGLLLGMTAAKFAELVAQAHASGHASN
jgi:hypothetical protein